MGKDGVFMSQKLYYQAKLLQNPQLLNFPNVNQLFFHNIFKNEFVALLLETNTIAHKIRKQIILINPTLKNMEIW